MGPVDIYTDAIADSIAEGIKGWEDVLRRRAEWGTIVHELEVGVGVPVNVFIGWECIEVIDTGEPSRAFTFYAGIMDASAAITEGADKCRYSVERFSFGWAWFIECNGRRERADSIVTSQAYIHITCSRKSGFTCTYHDPVDTWSKQGLVLKVLASRRPASCLSLSVVSCNSSSLWAKTHLSPKGQSLPRRIFLHNSIFFLKNDLRADLTSSGVGESVSWFWMDIGGSMNVQYMVMVNVQRWISALFSLCAKVHYKK